MPDQSTNLFRSCHGQNASLSMQIKEMETAATKTESKRAIEEARTESTAKAKARLESDIAAAANKHKAELEAQKQHYEGLLQQSRSSQV